MPYQYDYFISYAHDDDKSQDGTEDGFVSRFVSKLRKNKELYNLLGAEPRVFFDKSTLRGMDDWDAKIHEGIAGARFFIALVSENYFKSEFCAYEFKWWVSHEVQRQLVGIDVAIIQIGEVESLLDFEVPTLPVIPDKLRKRYPKWVENLRKSQISKSFNLSKRRSTEIDATLHELKEQSAERVYKQDAAERSPLSRYYPRHNENFVGRREELDKLRKVLATSKAAALSAVNGLGGIGKTALALTYGHAFAWDYELGRAFVPCEGQTSLRSAILSANLVGLVGLERLEGNEEEQYNQFWRLLEKKRAKIVERNQTEGRDPDLGARLYLILDNVTSPELVSNAELAQLPEFVRAVATTRESLELFSHIEGQTLDALSEEEALELLDNLRQFTTDSDKEAALEIVKLLGGFAFAVEIVGSYLRQKTYVSYREYADRLRADLLKVLDEATLTKGLQLRDHQVELVKNVLSPTLAALSESAQALIDVASLFAPDAIPIPWLGELLELNPDAVREGLFELENFGLLTPLDATQKGEIWNATLARLHRLAREQIRAALPSEFCDAKKQAIRDKSKKTLESDSGAFFQPGADWSLTAIFEFYLELVSELKDSPFSEIDLNLTWTLRTLGRLFVRLGRMTQARAAFSGYEAVCKDLAEAFPDDLTILRESSVSFNDSGDLERAEGNAEKAREFYQKAMDIAQRLAKDLPNDVQVQRDLSISFNKSGDLELAEGNAEKAREFYQKDLKIRQRLAEDLPNDVQAQRDLSISFECSGDLELAEGNAEKAREFYQKDLDIAQRLAEDLPNDVQAQRDLSISFERSGDLERAEGNAEKAREFYLDSLGIWQKLAQIVPNDVQIQRGASVPLERLGDLELAEGNAEKARKFYQKALKIRRRLAEDLPNDVQAQRGLSVSFNESGDLELVEGNAKKAREFYQKAMKIRQRLAEDLPNDVQVQRDFSISFERSGDLERAEGNAEKAREFYQKALKIRQRLVEDLPNDVQAQRDLFYSYYQFGSLSQAEKDFVAARDYFLLALEPATRNFERTPGYVQFRQDLAAVYHSLVDVKMELSNVEAATRRGRFFGLFRLIVKMKFGNIKAAIAYQLKVMELENE